MAAENKSWDEWLRENLARGVSPAKLSDRMAKRGFSPEDVARRLQAAGLSRVEAPPPLVTPGRAGIAFGRSPSCLEIPDFLTPDEADTLLGRLADSPLTDGRISGGVSDPRIRDNLVGWVDLAATSPAIRTRLLERILVVNQHHYLFNITEPLTRMQVARYEPGGHYAWHMDTGAGPSKMRKLTVVLQLSDPGGYQGGDLEIMATASPRAMTRAQGALIVFPAYIMHRVTPVTAGIRHSLTAWSLGPPFA